MSDLAAKAQKIAQFLQTLTAEGRFRLKYRITAGAGAADPDGFEQRDIYVELSGPDAPLLTAREGEVLRAFEHMAAQVLHLDPAEHDRVSFDALGFKAERAADIKEMAERAVEQVTSTGRPFHFPPMNSRERRMLHLVLKEHDNLRTESSGEGPRRFVVLYPRNAGNTQRAAAIGKAFRRR